MSGRNGENLIRAEGTTQAEAWRRATEQAREELCARGQAPKLSKAGDLENLSEPEANRLFLLNLPGPLTEVPGGLFPPHYGNLAGRP